MKYNVLISRVALSDIVDLYEYIRATLQEPTIAAKMNREILKAIDSLSEFPLRTPPVNEEPYRSKEIRKLLVKNYYIVYQVQNEQVTILRVLYNRREGQDLL